MEMNRETENAGEKRPLELYIHIPFCEKKCDYCDFLSAPAGEAVRRAYVAQLIEEIRAEGQVLPDCRLTSIFIGGGTPSALSGLQIFNILSAVYESFAVDSGAEISIECNPGTLNETKLSYYREAGINRVSLGLQSTDNEELRLLGRIHSYEDFLHSYELVRAAGFRNVNIDLMSALPGQTPESWRAGLKKVLMLRPEHISAYSLILEEGTPFYQRYALGEGRAMLPDEDAEREMYADTQRMLAAQGYQRYEISNYARPGCACRHNIGYWTGAEYLGVGLGASSLILNHRYHSETELQSYLHVRMHEDLTPLYQDLEALSPEDRMEEFMYLGLRMMEGVSGAEFYERFGQNMFTVFEAAIRKNLVLKLIEQRGSQIRLTERGIDVSNRVFADFYHAIPRK